METIPAWSRSRTQRLVRKPKVIVSDSGLCAELAGLDEATLTSPLGVTHLGELRGGRVLGIEVRSTAKPGHQHATGLLRLRRRLGDDFIGGIVLNTGRRVFSMGDDIWAVPVPALWQL